MNDEVVRRAARALRVQATGENDRAQETRSKLLATVRQGNQRRRHLLVVIVPLAAAFVASSLLAAAMGRPLSGSWEAVRSMTNPTHQAARRMQIPGLARALQPVAPQPGEQPGVEVARSSINDGPLVMDREAPRVATTASAVHHDAGDPEHASYLAAHRSHFGGGASSVALQAWDAYLREFPSGKFGPEARYNRALCLVKLGRKAEASRALEPFARGGYGGYRQRDAQELLEALDAR